MSELQVTVAQARWTVAGEEDQCHTIGGERGAWSKLLGFETVSSPHLVTGSAFSFSPNHQHQQQKGRSREKEHRN